jgi:hypothetical protein
MLPKIESGLEDDFQLIKNILMTTQGQKEKWADTLLNHIRERFYKSDISQITPHFIFQALKGQETPFESTKIANEFLKRKSNQNKKNIQTKMF